MERFDIFRNVVNQHGPSPPIYHSDLRCPPVQTVDETGLDTAIVAAAVLTRTANATVICAAASMFCNRFR